MEQDEQSKRVAGRVFLQTQLVGWIALFWGIGWAIAATVATTTSSLATGAALMFFAAAVAFGMLANAVLRR
jgi:hypothetical protein